MKLKLSAALVAGAFAGLAATSAQAGVLQASFKVFAAEVFGGAAVTLTAPTAAYNLSRPLSGTAANPNNFTISFTLDSGAWVVQPNAELRDVNNGNALAGTFVNFTNGGRTANYSFVVNNGITYPVNSTISFGNVAVGTVNGVNVALAAPMNNACTPTQSQINASVKMTNASGIEFDTNDPGSDVIETLFASNVALRADGTSSSALAPLAETSQVDVLIPSLGRFFTATADVTGASTTVINIGRINLADRGAFFDTDGLTNYSLANLFGAALGQVDASNLTLTITGQLNATGALGLFTDAACTVATAGAQLVSYNGTRDTTTIVYTPNAADWAFGAVTPASGQVYACYTVLGAAIIPTTQFRLTGTALNKTPGSAEIADPINQNGNCPSTLYDLRSNGVQVDVRNWIHPAQAAATGWTSVLRVINPSDTQTITVVGQTIDTNGTLGATGTITTLPPRAAKYFTSADLGALLTSGIMPGADTNNARLRLTANGPSLRVQNYVLNGGNGNFFEASSAQGDDGFVVPGAGSTRSDIPAQNNK